MSDKPVTHDKKVACLKRELALRRNVYRLRVAKGAMKQETADNEIAIMTAILHDYETVEEWDAQLLHAAELFERENDET